MTGGPISDGRIESDEQGMVTFTARSKSKQKSNSPQPRRIEVSGTEFVRRWSLHVLPKGFTRSRCYGGYHGSRRKAYLATCRQLLPAATAQPHPHDEPATMATGPKCPQCKIEMECIANISRPSWRDILGPISAHPQKPCGRLIDSPWHRVPQRNHPVRQLPVCHLPFRSVNFLARKPES